MVLFRLFFSQRCQPLWLLVYNHQLEWFPISPYYHEYLCAINCWKLRAFKINTLKRVAYFLELTACFNTSHTQNTGLFIIQPEPHQFLDLIPGPSWKCFKVDPGQWKLVPSTFQNPEKHGRGRSQETSFTDIPGPQNLFKVKGHSIPDLCKPVSSTFQGSGKVPRTFQDPGKNCKGPSGTLEQFLRHCRTLEALQICSSSKYVTGPPKPVPRIIQEMLQRWSSIMETSSCDVPGPRKPVPRTLNSSQDVLGPWKKGQRTFWDAGPLTTTNKHFRDVQWPWKPISSTSQDPGTGFLSIYLNILESKVKGQGLHSW